MGAAASYNLMEDAATAEISRSQVWPWVRHRARLGERADGQARFKEAVERFEEVAPSERFVEFLNGRRGRQPWTASATV